MKFNPPVFLLLTLLTFSGCKKDEKEDVKKDFELRFVELSENVQVIAGSNLEFSLQLFDHGRQVKDNEYWDRGFSSKLNVIEGPQDLISGEMYMNRLGLFVTIPIVEGRVKCILELYLKGTLVATAPLSFLVSVPKEGWIPRNIRGSQDVYETRDGKIYSIHYNALYRIDPQLSVLEEKNSAMEGKTFFAANGNKVYAFSNVGRLFVSGDEGSSFNQRLTGLMDLQFATLLNDGRIIIGSADSALVTEDEGLSWKPFNVPGGIRKVRQLKDGAFIVLIKNASSEQVLYHSVSAATKPKSIKLPQGMVDMEVVGNTIFVLTRERVYRSVNKGSSFEEVGVTKSQANYLLFTNGQHLVILGESVCITKNLETTEQLKEVQTPRGLNNIRLLSGNRLAACISEGGYLRVLSY